MNWVIEPRRFPGSVESAPWLLLLLIVKYNGSENQKEGLLKILKGRICSLSSLQIMCSLWDLGTQKEFN